MQEARDSIRKAIKVIAELTDPSDFLKDKWNDRLFRDFILNLKGSSTHLMGQLHTALDFLNERIEKVNKEESKTK